MKTSSTHDALVEGRLFEIVLRSEDPNRPAGSRDASGCYPAAETVEEALLFFARWNPSRVGRTAEIYRGIGRDVWERLEDRKVTVPDFVYGRGTVVVLRCPATGEETRAVL